MEQRIKALEIEVSYLRKELDDLKKQRPIESHTHYHYDYSNMKPMIITDPKMLDNFDME